MKRLIPRGLALLALVALCLAAGCRKKSASGRTRTLTLGAYTTPREAYGRAVLPAFQRYWRERTGETVTFRESYQGSGAQSRAIVGGFEADVAALSLEADVDKIAQAGLITHDWKAGPSGGMVTRSVVVIAVRQGNPRGIHNWDDLRRPGLAVLTPDVRTSGGAMWNIAALYGAALRGGTAVARGDAAGAQALLADVLRNVSIMDRGAREAMITFERGVGDAAITYENEVLVGRQNGQTYEPVLPRATIVIENPVAVVDAYATRHHNLDLARAFVDFLRTPEAQRAFTRYGLRSIDESVAREAAANFPQPAEPFTIRDLGGWPAVQRDLFAPGAVYDRAVGPAGSRPRP
jgi:sulfate transport system substrate-binding protein